jgi:hypothetical protein
MNYSEVTIQELYRSREKLRIEIEAKRADLQCLDRTIELVGGKIPPSTITICGPFTGVTNQPATLQFMKEHPDRWWKASEVVKELVRLGLVPTKHIAATITITLNRLHGKGILLKERREKANQYKYITENQEAEDIAAMNYDIE